MNLVQRYHFLALVAILPVLGCGATEARYTPTSSEARTSLESALTAWRDGKPFGPINGTPSVQIADTPWQSGQQMESFEIGEERDDGDGVKQFVVELKMKKPAGEKSVRYFIQGRDPTWVYSEEDFKRMLNMDNNPVDYTPKKARSGRLRKDR